MSVELEKARSEILTLKRELAAVKLECRTLKRAPSEDGKIKSEKRNTEKLSKDRDDLAARLEATERELAKFKRAERAAKSERKAAAESFVSGPDLKSDKLRKQLRSAHAEIRRLNNASDQQ